jgi:hypothetical protein
MPDAGLMAAADAGQLGSSAPIEAQARRLLTSARAHATMIDLHTEWLGLQDLARVEIDTKTHPLWSDAVRDAALAEPRACVEKVLWSDGGSLARLLTAP